MNQNQKSIYLIQSDSTICTEAMSEAAVDIISTKLGVNDEKSELAYSKIFHESKINFQSFVQLIPMSFGDLYENPIVYEYYILLRISPYKYINQGSSLHLQKTNSGTTRGTK